MTWGNNVARRFEVYVNGIELANGYHELTDAQEQERRFALDHASKKLLMGKVPMAADIRLIAGATSWAARVFWRSFRDRALINARLWRKRHC